MEVEHPERLNWLGGEIAEQLRQMHDGRDVGFVLFVFKDGETPGKNPAEYITNCEMLSVVHGIRKLLIEIEEKNFEKYNYMIKQLSKATGGTG